MTHRIGKLLYLPDEKVLAAFANKNKRKKEQEKKKEDEEWDTV